MAAPDLDVPNVAIRAGQTLGPYAFTANAADRYASVVVAVGTGNPDQRGPAGGGVEVLVEATPPGNAWRQVAVLSFGLDTTIESVSLLAGYTRYRVSATATRDTTLSLTATRG